MVKVQDSISGNRYGSKADCVTDYCLGSEVTTRLSLHVLYGSIILYMYQVGRVLDANVDFP